LIWAWAVPAKAIAAPRARPRVANFFMHISRYELSEGVRPHFSRRDSLFAD
jgi:hypothetical protein